MNNKTLLYIFAALLVIFFLTRIFTGDKKSSFDPTVVEVDTSEVTQITLTPKAEGGEQIVLRESPDGLWSATKGDRTVQTPYNKIQGLLGQMSLISAKRIVSKSPDKWSEYEVGDQGSRVEVMAGSKKLADFIVGTFKFDQIKRSASSYVRRYDQDQVYFVDGLLSMQFNQGFSAFRNNQLVKINNADVRRLTLQRDDETTIIQQQEDGHWYLAGMEQLDSASVTQYVTGLNNVTGSAFADDFTPAGDPPLKSLTITGNNMPAPVEINCYANRDTSMAFVLHSSTNPQTYFLSDSTGVYNRLFGKLEDLLAGQ